jgi:osmotically-inducible protein OsmY
MKSISFAAGIVAMTLLLACGGSDPAVDLEKASKAAEQTRSARENALEKVKQREAEVKEAQARLEEARKALRDIEAELAKRVAKVDKSATDEVLFRAVQKRLLEDGDLASVAIAAHVNNGLVTLTGNVPKAALSDRAVVVASETAGVQRVENRIAVVDGKAAKPAANPAPTPQPASAKKPAPETKH